VPSTSASSAERASDSVKGGTSPPPASTSTTIKIGRVLGRARDDLALGVHRQRRTVEHQIVLAAHLVHEHQRALPVPCHTSQHARPQVSFLDGEGRRRDVDQEIRARIHQLLDGIFAVQPVRPEVAVVPNVLADGNAQAAPAKGHRRDGGGGLEVAPFIEDVVGGQQRLAPDGHDLAVVDQRPPSWRCRPAFTSDSTSGKPTSTASCPARSCTDRTALALARLQKSLALQQIARRIAAHHELGQDQQVGPGRVGHGLADKAQIALEIADGGVELAECDLHAGSFLRKYPAW
jgi:hypothetical protein